MGTNACATEGVTPRHLPSGTSTPSWKYMNAEGFAQVPDLDEQLNSPSTAVNALRQHASSFDDDMYAHQFNKQTPYLGQDGSLPQHFMQGVPDMNAGQSFPLGRSTPSVNMFTTVNAPVSSSGAHPADKPTPAQAAAGRLQRASARQAAKAAQQQKRQAQSRASASTKKGSDAGTKRKKDEVAMEEEEEDDDDEEDSDDDDTGAGDRQPKPHEIAKTKYNHVEDEKERKRLKRLLRNRVSAQQARERKKAYMSTLEDERRAMEAKTAALESKINTLERENFMLRQVVKNSTKAGNEKMGMALAADEPRAVPSH